MRISGYGGAFGRGLGGDRREGFRRRHVLGQVVGGRVLRVQSPGMVWIEIDGQPLLSALEGEPVVGQIMFFEIVSLAPRIVLRLVDGGRGGVLGDPALCREFVFGLQDRLRERLGGRMVPGNGDWETRRLNFVRVLSEDNEALGAWLELAELEEHAGRILLGRGWLFRFAPWLSGLVERAEVLFQPGGPEVGLPRWTLAGMVEAGWIRSTNEREGQARFFPANGPLLPELIMAGRGLNTVV
ncbi:MAG: hypothetical protein EOM25_05920 [Deltaproteobacteria bacterium]|nr:hypothetical protein [Deltaproteobacteria bacterium]